MQQIENPDGMTLKEYVDARDAQVEERVRAWIIRAVLVQLAACLPIIFGLGMLYSRVDQALDDQRVADYELDWREKWMDRQESRWIYTRDHLRRHGEEVPAELDREIPPLRGPSR